jgi:hypothetical protein
VGVNCLGPSPANFILLVAGAPVILLNPDFQPDNRGQDVGWFFFGPWIKSAKAFVIFTLYFMVLSYLLLLGVGYKALRRREEAVQPHFASDESGEPAASADRPGD